MTKPIVHLLALALVILPVLHPASGQAQQATDSVAAWTSQLRSAPPETRMHALGKLASLDSETLPTSTYDAVAAELERVEQALLEDRPVFGEATGGESLGEYFLTLATLAAEGGEPRHHRSLILAVDVSGGIQKRVARLGDAAIPTLDEMIRRNYQVHGALTTMGLAWYWADSTEATLSLESRRVVVDNFIRATSRGDFTHLLGVKNAIRHARDPIFLPLAQSFEQRLQGRSQGADVVARLLRSEVIPELSERESQSSPGEFAGRLGTLLDALCLDPDPGPKLGACRSLQNRLATARRHIEGGRAGPARDVLESFVGKVERAHGQGAFTDSERTLLVGNAEALIERL